MPPYRRLRKRKRFSNLRCCPSIHFVPHHDLSLPRRQPGDGRREALTCLALLHLQVGRCAIGRLEVREFFGSAHFPHPLRIEPEVHEYPKEPWRKGALLIVLIDAFERAQTSFLHKIFGIFRVIHQSPSERGGARQQRRDEGVERLHLATGRTSYERRFPTPRKLIVLRDPTHGLTQARLAP